ncbi:hypothetical protein RFI_36025 [Reticulomyxa filosa]|uniref:Uncharacterized protein n=1 Tax=Reticulomyxa filosa TaxID=46433 RepID=X6LL38_RETFI|nr:hypothetical protein RFI_36025 [Reticulomyxa filosa]|eukprot:ETO01415.1 hypothetical protein RFI_36025 [Reticulomyxa filosa]
MEVVAVIIEMNGKVIDVSLFGPSPVAVCSNNKTKDSSSKDLIQLKHLGSDESFIDCKQVVQSSVILCNKHSIEDCIFGCCASIEYLILDNKWYCVLFADTGVPLAMTLAQIACHPNSFYHMEKAMVTSTAINIIVKERENLSAIVVNVNVMLPLDNSSREL